MRGRRRQMCEKVNYRPLIYGFNKQANIKTANVLTKQKKKPIKKLLKHAKIVYQLSKKVTC